MRPKSPSKVKEYAEVLIFALLLALVIRTFIVAAVKFPSGSMIPTLQIGDQLLVSKFSYGIKIPYVMKTVIPVGEPRREDIIVFIYPEDRTKDFVKRVIGLPGDVVEIRNKQLYLNGRAYGDAHGYHADPLILPGAMQPRDNFGPVSVPPGSLFVMGDNRDFSADSRFWGFVEQKDVLGRAFMIFFSWDKEKNGVRWDRIGKILK